VAERGERFVDELTRRIDDLTQLIETLGDEQWRRACAGEGWPVGFVAYHISLGLERQANWIERRASGGPLASFDWEGTHALNAALLRRHGLPSKELTAAALRRRAARMGRIARSLTDQQLDGMTVRIGEHERSAEWILRRVALAHIDDHTRSIRAAIDQP
jgi:hypothetical protein